MSYNTTIPDHDDGLYIKSDTTAADIAEFVERRVTAPAVLGDIVVWNFSSYQIDTTALLRAANDLDSGRYVVPYQVPGAWGTMVELLPSTVADGSTLLVYRKNEEEYAAYENWRNSVEPQHKHAIREAFETWAEEEIADDVA